MEMERNTDFTDTIEHEADRIREIFKHSFSQSESSLKGLASETFTSADAHRIGPDNSLIEDEFDWSVTLAHVEAIVDASQTSQALLQAAEKRAEIAEARAREAVHWLKMLHQAVLKGLPEKAR